jgi:hypothetical protein
MYNAGIVDVNSKVVGLAPGEESRLDFTFTALTNKMIPIARGQFFEWIFAPTGKFAPTEKVCDYG